MSNMKIHFIGINGSGASGVAIAAKKAGFIVNGCDRAADTPYAPQVRANGIPVADAHDADHIDDADIVAVSPALIMQSEKIPEVAAAQTAGKLMTWQEFLGTYILAHRRVIAVCGTHGKTTTSALCAHVMESAGLDPTAFIGAIVPDWNGSNRIGSSDWIVLEADEYANNFKHYHPEFIILNNLEMEHPEYFRDFEYYKQTFRDFLAGAKSGGTLVYNADDKDVLGVIDSFPGKKIPFGTADLKISANERGQDFDGFHINLLGAHNAANATAVITMVRELGISDEAIRNALADFHGAGHRCEKICDRGDIAIYDDYAHHHTQAARTIDALRAAYPDARLVVVYEPHQISRYTQNRAETLDALGRADVAIITEFWRGREGNLSVPDVNADIKNLGATNIQYIPNQDEAIAQALNAAKEDPARKSIILVMGAGQSWKIAKALKESL